MYLLTTNQFSSNVFIYTTDFTQIYLCVGIINIKNNTSFRYWDELILNVVYIVLELKEGKEIGYEYRLKIIRKVIKIIEEYVKFYTILVGNIDNKNI